MSRDWADRVAQQLFDRLLTQRGKCLLLGASDTGKTTLAAAIAKRVASACPVGFVDADIGQSHIGPPTTVGWALVEEPATDFSQLSVGGRLKSFELNVERIKCPSQMSLKSLQQRRNYRQRKFSKYFQDSRLYNVDLTEVAVQAVGGFDQQNLVNRIIALRDASGVDLALALVEDWQADKDIAVIRAPGLDIARVRCLVIGDVTIDITGGTLEVCTDD